MHTHTYTYTYTHSLMCTYTYLHTQTHAHIRAYAYTHAHMRVQARKCTITTHTHTHTHTNTHTHTSQCHSAHRGLLWQRAPPLRGCTRVFLLKSGYACDYLYRILECRCYVKQASSSSAVWPETCIVETQRELVLIPI
jgi:hypothetical protein